MSHHTESFAQMPHTLHVEEHRTDQLQDEIELLICGQGVLICKAESTDDISFTIGDEAGNELRLSVADGSISVENGMSGARLAAVEARDSEPGCRHWFSLDSANRTIKYGRGEVRDGTALIRFDATEATYDWIASVASIGYGNSIRPERVLRDPVVFDPPLKVLPTSLITIEDIARSLATVPANLSPECRQLYDNIGGENFRLDTPDFPEFVDAVEASIRNPDGWCHRRLKEKATEFGEENLEETYLRITVGRSQGESPGIPYVVEIWPPGHYSPVHNHANTHAIIRVLTGEISVSLFPMLSRIPQEPFAEAMFRKGDVTWISPQYNQTHRLHNTNSAGPVCITIQCYLYGGSDSDHYGYFDYLDERGEVCQFTPNSDADFLEFKELMKREWRDGVTNKWANEQT